MNPEALAEHIRTELGERVLATDIAYDQLTVTVAPEAFPQAARFCKTDQSLDMRFFDWLGGVDEREDGFSVVARLYSHVHRHGLLLKTMVPGGRDEPRLPTLTDVYQGANWHERETYDMFGIIFEGHPGLLPRILTVENFEGWPLRKDFVLASREVKPWPGAKEPGGGEEEESGGGKPAASAPGSEPEDRAAAAKAKAERAKKKAAEARARKAAERAAALEAEGEEAAGADAPDAGTSGAEEEGVHDLEDSSARDLGQDEPDGTDPEEAEDRE